MSYELWIMNYEIWCGGLSDRPGLLLVLTDVSTTRAEAIIRATGLLQQRNLVTFHKTIGEDNGVLIIPDPINQLPWQPLFQNPILRIFTWNFLKCIFISSVFMERLNLNKIETFSMFLINFWLILSSFWIFQKIQDGGHEINMASYDVTMTS